MDKIIGVPAGYKLVRIDRVDPGESYIGFDGKVYYQNNGTQFSTVAPVVELDNYYGVPLETVPIPKGFELDGFDVESAYRIPKVGEQSITPGSLRVHLWFEPINPDGPRLIVKKIQKPKKMYFIIEAPCEIPDGNYCHVGEHLWEGSGSGDAATFLFKKMPTSLMKVRYEERES